MSDLLTAVLPVVPVQVERSNQDSRVNFEPTAEVVGQMEGVPRKALLPGDGGWPFRTINIL